MASDEKFLTYLCAISLKATGSVAVMEMDQDNMAVFALLKNIRWTKGPEVVASGYTPDTHPLATTIRAIKSGEELVG